MIIESFGLKIDEFEDLLHKLSTNVAANAMFERLPPSDIWNRSETIVTSLKSLSEHLRDTMILLNPERISTIKKRFQAFSQPLESFRDRLFHKSDDPMVDSRLALEQLRKTVSEGTNLVDLAKEIKREPSRSISEILKIKEVYEAKSYLSDVSIPEAVHARFNDLSRTMEKLKLRLYEVEQALGELGKQIEGVQKEMSKFKPPQPESPAGNTGSEPATGQTN